MAIERSTIHHLYDNYPLYATLYSRCYAWKAAEARGMAFALSHLASHSARQALRGHSSLNFEAEGFDILEIFAGKGEHSSHLQLPEPLWCGRYAHNDIRDHSASCQDFIVGDSMSLDVREEGFNVIAALFYTMSSLHDDNAVHSREILLRLFRNVYQNLPEGGAFFADFCRDGYQLSLAVDSTNDMEDEDDNTTVELDPDSPLRKAYGIPYNVNAELVYKKKSVYNRITSTSYDHFTTPIRLYAGSKLVAEITVKEPLSQRYFSEPELVDIAKEAGFTDFLFFSLDYSDSDFRKLSTEIQEEGGLDTDEIDTYMSNAIMFIK